MRELDQDEGNRLLRLLRYEDVRELVRGIDQQISALQQSLITLRDTLAALS